MSEIKQDLNQLALQVRVLDRVRVMQKEHAEAKELVSRHMLKHSRIKSGRD
jgi:hypothetical protein